MKKTVLKTVTLALAIIALLLLVSCGHEHTEQIIPEITPTCTQGGFTEGKKCADCGETIIEPTPIPSKGHTEEPIPNQAPTCTEEGYENGKKCADCDEIIIEPTPIPSKGHTEEPIPNQAPTCTEEGYENGKKCADCGVVLQDPTPLAPRHTEEIIPKIAPDVGISGFTEGKKCSACNDVLVAPTEITLLEIEIDDASSIKGKINATLTLDKVNGEFSFYYADEDKNALPYYNALAKPMVSEENDQITLDIVLPSECEYIIATNNTAYTYFVKIPEKYTLGESSYTYGSLSDVHTNDGNYFDGALDFFDEYGEIDFVAISGDISDGAVKDLEWFNETIKDRLYKVYTTTGNHDEASVKNGRWLEYINTSIKTDNEVFEISENGLDFVFIPEKNEDSVFVFFCQTSWSYLRNPTGTEYSLVTADQLEWLEAVLEKYKDKTVLLYFHTFLSAPDGSQESSVGNLRNPGGYAYDLPYSYGAGDEVIFRNLLKEYKNVVFFSGHSHWMFELEKYNPNLNVSNFDGEYCYMVHNPSVCTPRWIGDTDSYRTNKKGLNSEGWIVEIHDDALVLIPVDFLSQTFYTEYMKLIPIS